MKGRPPIAEDAIRIQAIVPKELARRARLLAVNTDVTLPDIVRAAIREYVERGEAAGRQE